MKLNSLLGEKVGSRIQASRELPDSTDSFRIRIQHFIYINYN